MKRARAFAPASVANVAVGFDILGFSFAGAGDLVEVEWNAAGTSGIEVAQVRSPYAGAAGKIPKDSLRNTAAVSLQAMINGLSLEGSFKLNIDKGIPLSSGMGGSAASAVAAVVALNACLPAPRPWSELLGYALEGERVASGSTHLDNVLPCLRGGFNLVAAPGHYAQIPVPAELHCALVHPELEIQTRYARSVLSETTTLALHVKQSAYLGGFIAGLWTSNWDLLKATLHDVIVEPQRQKLIPSFAEAKTAALRAGALGFSISGSGPTVFALTRGAEDAEAVRKAVHDTFTRAGLPSQSWAAPVQAGGAKAV